MTSPKLILKILIKELVHVAIHILFGPLICIHIEIGQSRKRNNKDIQTTINSCENGRSLICFNLNTNINTCSTTCL